MFKKLIASIAVIICLAPSAFAGLSLYPKGFPDGISVRGMPILNTYSGNVYWVGSGTANASNSNKGDSPERPFQTISYVLNNKVAANHGDIIMVLPSHTEDLGSSTFTLPSAGVAIVGLGVGSNRPTFTWGTNTTKIHIKTSNHTFKNLYFDMTGAGSVTTGIDIDGDYCVFEDCGVLQSSGNNQCNVAFDIGTSSATEIRNLKCVTPGTASAGASSCIFLSGTASQFVLVDSWIDGNYGSATIFNPIGGLQTNIVIKNNMLRNQKTTVIAVDLNGSCTGFLANNLFQSDVGSSTAVDPGALWCYQNYTASRVDKSAVLTPTALDP